MQPSLVPDRSSTGLDPKIAGLLCYLGSFITGIIFLALEKNSSFVKFHAMQSIAASVALIVINLLLGFIPVIGPVIAFILSPVAFVLWIYLMLTALQGKWFKLPILGEWAHQQASKF
ncbi:DUF4870 domain-containing protein [Paenibacillus sp. GCM10023252]|uniref:DUF4870 domain-containing protein n=1 Tax=Paenibacillus sp. GCM10023252 TaxID=3252649 RepID=UPI00360BF51F